MIADDSYAGSATYYRLENKVNELFGTEYFLPAHQGRACESILSEAFVKPGDVVPMNYHFTTSKAHVTRVGGIVEELVVDEGRKAESDCLFKGNIDLDKLQECITRVGAEHIPYVRLEAGTNLIGGQPFSLENLKATSKMSHDAGIPVVLDASLLQDNLYFIKTREAACRDMSIREITREMCAQADIIYFSARKLGFARGGGIAMFDRTYYERMKDFIPLFEGFLTYGGMSVREMEAMTVGLEETMDESVISQGPQFIAFMVDELQKRGVPVVTPAGGLGCHVNARAFLSHVDAHAYPAAALAAATFIAGGVRGMERGTLSEQREPDGTEPIASMELLRLALPRRVFTMSQVLYAVDRLHWLYENRRLVGGLNFVEEPATLRFFFGRLEPIGDWQERLKDQFRADFGDSL
jgi:tryptophanase